MFAAGDLTSATKFSYVHPPVRFFCLLLKWYLRKMSKRLIMLKKMRPRSFIFLGDLLLLLVFNHCVGNRDFQTHRVKEVSIDILTY